MIELSALAVVENSEVRSLVLKALEDHDIEPHFCDSDLPGLERLKRQKFDLVVLDSDACNPTNMLQAVRSSASSSKALVFAITNSPEGLCADTNCGGTFAVRKPVREDDISSLIRAGYGTMLRERRQYFRCNATTAVQIDLGGQTVILARSTNLSAGGMAVETEFPMQAGANVEMTFALPTSGTHISTLAQVVWADQRGKAGFRFVSLAPEMQRRLDEWLSTKFDAQLEADRDTLVGQPMLVPAS